MIDKDYAGALLAQTLHADLFLISTAVEKVALHFNKPHQKWIDHMTVEEAKIHLADGHFHKGSMGPKIQAAIWFLEGASALSETAPHQAWMHNDALHRREALITNPDNLERALRGETGTRITR